MIRSTLINKFRAFLDFSPVFFQAARWPACRQVGARSYSPSTVIEIPWDSPGRPNGTSLMKASLINERSKNFFNMDGAVWEFVLSGKNQTLIICRWMSRLIPGSLLSRILSERGRLNTRKYFHEEEKKEKYSGSSPKNRGQRNRFQQSNFYF
jgi:hypothetical protein